MKGLIILENGFEDTEALASFDVLFRAGIKLDKVSLNNTSVKTQVGHIINTDMLIKDIKSIDEYDFLLIPGGRAVSEVLSKSKEVEDLIDLFYNKGKLIASICAAPSLIGRKGYFDGLTYTCFPGFEKLITKGKKGKDGVIVNDKFITATSMYYSINFGLAIVEKLLGKDIKRKVENSLMGK